MTPYFARGQIEVQIGFDAQLWDGMWLSLRCVQGNLVWVYPPASSTLHLDDDRCGIGKRDIIAMRCRDTDTLWSLVQRLRAP